MEIKTDIRIIKTKRKIKEVFAELLSKKEFKKITVTEIAKTAEINKGTFYLHYKDIYDLYAEVMKDDLSSRADSFSGYGDFLESPDLFVQNFLEFAKTNLLMPDLCTAIQEISVTDIIAELFRRKIYENNNLPVTAENNIRLDYIIFSFLFFLRNDNISGNLKTITQILSSVISSSFIHL